LPRRLDVPAIGREIRENDMLSTPLRYLSRISLAAVVFSGVAFSQTADYPQSTWKTKLDYHAAGAYSPLSLVGTAAWAALLQARNSPREWGKDEDAYFKRMASTSAYLGIRHTLGFGLDTLLHEDPRYYRSTEKGAWRRIGHAVRETIMTHKDSGGETLALWRFGSAYGAAFLSNEWQPDRLNTAREGFNHGTAQLGFDVLANLREEFWPDIRKKLFKR
jgi:hypothetical protein